MSVIQSIRNKYIGLVIGLIVLALIGFLVMDALQSNTRNIFSSDRTTLAKVNGDRIDYVSYDALQKKYEENMKARNKNGSLSDEERNQLQQQVWNDILNDAILQQEMDKLGLTFTDKELRDIETSPYADPMIQQNFRDPNTGIFDGNRVSQYIAQLGQGTKEEQIQKRNQWREFEEGLIKSRKQTKYNDLYAKAIYFPKFVLEDMAKQRTAKSSINFVNIPYTSLSDSAVTVTDAEVQKYIDKNAKLMQSEEDLAKFDYVVFDVIPTSADSAESIGKLLALKDTFTKSSNVEQLINDNSEEAIHDTYYTKNNLEMPQADIVIAGGVGSVTGPIFDNGVYKMAKVLDKKSMPDSVKASHILIAVSKDRSEEQAKASIDSIEKIIKAGAPFDQIATQRSDDQGSAKKGGDLGYFAQGMMVPEFNDVAFNGKTGDLKVVKTQFGYHLIKITDQKNFQPAVKLAFMNRTLQASEATIQAVTNKATEFVAKAKDAKSFDATAKTMGKDKRTAENIAKTQSLIQGLGSSREISRWAFNNKSGTVSPVFSLTDKIVVALMGNIREKGSLPPVEMMKPQIEQMLKKEKKGKMIAEKYNGKTLEAIATAAASTVKTADTILMMGGGNPDIGMEPKVIGASFNKANLNKVSTGIAGEQGVYFIFVKNLIEGNKTLDPIGSKMEARQNEMQMAQQVPQYIQYILKKKAKIEDNRANFF